MNGASPKYKESVRRKTPRIYDFWKRTLCLAAALCAMCFVFEVLCMKAMAGSLPAMSPLQYGMPPVQYVSYVMINTGTEQVIVFDQDNSPIKVFSCSTGKYGNTISGTYATSDYYEWRLMNGGVYSRYAVRFNKGELMHSVPYYRRSPDSLEYHQYNKLGTPASAGCCRLALCDAKWIYDNTIPGTVVQVVNEPSVIFPLSRPNIKVDTGNVQFRGWDPTDTDPRSPYNQLLLMQMQAL